MHRNQELTCAWPKGCARAAWCKSFCRSHYYTAHRNGLLPRAPCSVAACDEPSFRKGVCNKHYIRLSRYGDVGALKKLGNGQAKNALCSVAGCTSFCAAKGLCKSHYDAKRRRGDPLAQKKKLGNGQATPERKKENSARAMRKYYKTPHGLLRRRYSQAKRRVLSGSQSEHIDKDQFLALWRTDRCAICHESILDCDKTIDHRIPLSRGGDNGIGNMQIAHLLCNQRKGARIIGA